VNPVGKKLVQKARMGRQQMCSGCFGEHEGREDFGHRYARHEDGTNESPDAASESRAEASSVDEFEVLVGVDSITEIRWVACKPLMLLAKDRGQRSSDRESADQKAWHTRGLSAKDYQTSASRRCGRRLHLVNGAKWLLPMAVALLSLAGLTLWFLLV
jgi:hypothetical protein